MTESDIREKVRNFILTMKDMDAADLEDDLSFEQSHVVDSMDMFEIIEFMEETFEFGVDDEDATPENFDSVNNLTAYIMRKRAS